MIELPEILIFLTLTTVPKSICFVEEADLYAHEEYEGSTRYYFGDDGTIHVPFTLPFVMFNRSHWGMHISGNGVVQLGSDAVALGASTDCQTTVDYLQKIMVFWSDANNDLDLSGTKLLYMETTRDSLLQKAKRDVLAGFPQFKRSRLNLSWMFIITWKDLLRHGHGGPNRNTFQLVLTQSESHSFVILYYSKLEWSSDVNWAAGFAFGNSRSMYTLPGSCTSNFEDIGNTSNIGRRNPGKWVFKVETDVESPGANAKLQSGKEDQSLSFEPRIVSIMGNMPVLIRGLFLEEDANITCSFLDAGRLRPSETKGVRINARGESIVICPVPYLYSLGKISVNLLVNYPTATATSLYKGHIYAVKEHELEPLPQIFINRTLESSLLLSATWNPASITMKDVMSVDMEPVVIGDNRTNNCQSLHEVIQIVILEYNGKSWKELGPMTPPILNNGVHLSPLNMTVLEELTKPTGKPFSRTFALKAEYTLKSGGILRKLLPSNTVIGTEMIISRQQNVNIDDAKDTKNKSNMFDKICKTWSEKEPHPPVDTLPCSRTVEQARRDWRFVIDSTPHLEIFNPGVSSSFIQRVPSPSGAGSQCTYDYQGRLFISIPGSGRLHRHSPNNWRDYWSHYWQDVMPFLYCCKWSVFKESNCISYYYSKRPADHGQKYVPPRPSRATGMSHISTFDGLNYTLAGGGEYWMLKYSDSEDEVPVHDYTNEFKMQIRLEGYSSDPDVDLDAVANQSLADPAIITAAVMEDASNGKSVKVQVSRASRQILVMVDGVSVTGNGKIGRSDNDEDQIEQTYLPDFNLYHDGVTISLSRNQVVATFTSGFSILFMTAGMNEPSLNIVITVSSHIIGRTKGLLGGLNNDLQLPNRTSSEISENQTTALRDFAMGWLVPEAESMFAYPPGESYADYNDPDINRTIYLYSEEDFSLVADDNEFCNGFQECNYDFSVTNSKPIAETGVGAFTLYKEILDVAATVENQCELPPKLVNGYLIASSLVVGSNMTASCNSGYILHPTNAAFTCEVVVVEQSSIDGHESESSHPQWLSTLSKERITSFTCVPEYPERDIIQPVPVPVTEATTKVPVLTTYATTRAPARTLEPVVPVKMKYTESDSGGRGVTGNEIFILLIVIAIAIIVVGVVGVIVGEYPPCKPMRMYIVNRFRPTQGTDTEELEL